MYFPDRGYNRAMDQHALENLLSPLPLGSLRYFDTLGSTNDLAKRWADAGAPDLSLVVADEQTAGRGRLDRRWLTPPGSGLAFSLILRPQANEFAAQLPHLTALGALAVCETLNAALPPITPAQIKWPNDVIAARRKLAGVLAETHWRGDKLVAAIVGIGINVAPSSVPLEAELDFPATCVEAVVEKPVERWELLRSVLATFIELHKQLASPDLMRAWEHRLAFRGEWIQFHMQNQPPIEGQVLGLEEDGSLKLRLRSGEVTSYPFGEIRLLPLQG